MSDQDFSRRELLLGATTALALPNALANLGALPEAGRKKVLRIAHLTDIHVQPEKGAPKGLEACLKHVQSHRGKDKVDVIFTGGDLIMDSLGADAARTKVQWDIFNSVLKANNTLPVEHCLGNHDVWGWSNISKYESEAKFGKKWALEALELEKPYRSFDRAGWHFIVLDSTHRTSGNGYTARLDDEQFEWLVDDLARTPKSTPIFVMSHIPIISVCSMFDGENEKTGNWVIPGSWIHIDARRIKDAFKKHPNVKICISGHEHLLDQVVYNGVNYFCNGAVCGGWWDGDYYECSYGYTLVDLYNDGSFENKYIPYGWKTLK